jgi:hypothetical protein
MFATQFNVPFPIFHSMLLSAVQPVPDDREKNIDLSFVWLEKKGSVLTLVGCNQHVIHSVSLGQCAYGPDFSFAWRKYVVLPLLTEDIRKDLETVRIEHDKSIDRSGAMCIIGEHRMACWLQAHPSHSAPPVGKVLGMIPAKWKRGSTKFKIHKIQLEAMVTPPATVKLTTKGMPLKADDFRLMATWEREEILPRKGNTGIPTQSDLNINTSQVQTWLAGFGEVDEMIQVKHDPDSGLLLQATRGDLTFTHFSAAIVRE